MIRVVSKKDSLKFQLENFEDFIVIDVTSHNKSDFWAKGLSPFYLGPVECYDGLIAQNVENAWQFSKVYPCHIDENDNPTSEFTKFRNNGFAKTQASRRPMGKGNIPCYSYWKINDMYVKLDYIQSRKLIYIPIYAKAVVKTDAYKKLVEYKEMGYNIALSDFDGYNHYDFNMTYKDVVNCKSRTLGHAFVIAMLLEGLIEVKGDEVIFSQKLKNM